MSSAQPVFDATRPVRAGEEVDAQRLGAYLASVLPDLVGTWSITQFPAGHSNLTYLVRCGERDLVLRRPPHGNRVKSAHDMGREYRVLSKLWPVYPPAPRPFHYCADETIIGAPFYVMERRNGLVLRCPLPAGVSLEPETMRRLCLAFIDNLAQLHALDYAAAGLADLGKPEGYVARQVAGWSKRYQDAKTEDIGELESASQWLSQHLPADGRPSLIHNDYKFDNLAVDPQNPTRIVAVFDWEMATIGDPLMDLGTTLGYWLEPSEAGLLPASTVGPTNLPGCLTRRQLIERYAAQSGRDVTNVQFYYAFGLFKIAVIIQQIFARYVRGHTLDSRFSNLGERVRLIGQALARVIDQLA
jgi:aminoglycoside phosphotransferase (APT) family kinase protein